MQHAALQLEYDGTPFRGWARQPGHPSVEGALLDACSELGLDVSDLRVAGRTDSGVHARAQVVSFAYNGPIPPDRLARALNTSLPPAISALASAPVSHVFDARADAQWREYEYRVLVRGARTPLRSRSVLHHPRPLDRDLLDQAASALIGQHDFTAFTPTETTHTFFHRTVLASHWRKDGDEMVYTIRANAFLRNMVRVTMGTMLAVGRGEWPLERFERLLAGAPRADAHVTAPPHALCLVGVKYDVDPFDPADRSFAASSAAAGHVGRADG